MRCIVAQESHNATTLGIRSVFAPQCLYRSSSVGQTPSHGLRKTWRPYHMSEELTQLAPSGVSFGLNRSVEIPLQRSHPSGPCSAICMDLKCCLLILSQAWRWLNVGVYIFWLSASAGAGPMQHCPIH